MSADHYISSEQQMSIVKDLYLMHDGIEAARKLKDEHGLEIIPGHARTVYHFAQELKHTHAFKPERLDHVIKEHTGEDLEISKL